MLFFRLSVIGAVASASNTPLVSVTPEPSTREEPKQLPILPHSASVVPVSIPIDVPVSCSNNPQRLFELISNEKENDTEILSLIKIMSEEELSQSIDGFTPLYAAIKHDRSYEVIKALVSKTYPNKAISPESPDSALVLSMMQLDSRPATELKQLLELFNSETESEAWKKLNEKIANKEFLEKFFITVKNFLSWLIIPYSVYKSKRAVDYVLDLMIQLKREDTIEKQKLFRDIWEKLEKVPDGLEDNQKEGKAYNWLLVIVSSFEFKNVITLTLLKKEIESLEEKLKDLNKEIEKLFEDFSKNNNIDKQVNELLLRKMFVSVAKEQFCEQFIEEKDVKNFMEKCSISFQNLEEAAKECFGRVQEVSPPFSLLELIKFLLDSPEPKIKTD